ncbi:hypothetical protein LAZ67_X001042, partial [Cordylochernes scorpioides]
MVIGLKRAGWSIRQIAADTHLGASTVHRLWRRWLEQGNVAIYRNVGATRVTSARVDRRILRQAVAAPQATCTAILQHVQDTLDHSISTRTISRRLVANGLHSCRPLRRLPLTPPNRRQRLEWCRARSTWMTEWHRVVFSDESRFCLSSDSRRVRVWRRRGERSNPAAIVERPTVRQRGIMVWGAIAYDSRSPLLRIQGTMTAQRYVDDVLRPVTLPYLQGVPNALYQQDNARPHTARISQQALQDVQMLHWPPYSPDLSPIEPVIGRRLHALPQPRSEDELWQMVEREWRAIPQDPIRTLIDSLPRRVAACIAVRVKEEDRDYLRFLWWKNDHQIQVFRHKRVVFGVTCSPYLLGAVILHHLKGVSSEFGVLPQKLMECLYIDNCVTSVDTEAELVDLVEKSTEIFAKAKMDLRMWQFGPIHRVKEVYSRLPPSVDIERSEEASVLGMKWNLLEDTLNRMPGHRKRRQFKQTDAFTRGMVIGLKRAGWSIRQIAADTHLGASTVHRLWRRWLEQGNVAIYRNADATRVTSARVDRRIIRQAVAAPQATCTAILQHVQDTLDHSISTRTISRRLVANGLHSCRPLRRMPLTPPNRRQRLEWCRARSTWMTEWHRVVFSDESRFCLFSDSRRVRVWRRRGKRSNPAAIVERPTVRQCGIMVWGAIAYDYRSPLLRIQGTMTAQRYVDDVLRPVTLPYLQGVPNALYQQDNARPHTARISQQALQDVQMLPWPPYSPDLSPIEHVWDIIGRRLHALPQPRSEDELWQMVERERRAMPQDAIRTLIDSLPRRVAACIAVRDHLLFVPVSLCLPSFITFWPLFLGVPFSMSRSVFCDASQSAYAAAAFLRCPENKGVSVQLLMAKSRLGPLKKTTILGWNFLPVCWELDSAGTEPVYYWTDSTTALSWIKTNRQWGTFVNNRVKEICNTSGPNKWFYVPGGLNPADLPSRGCSVLQLKRTRWWEGPEWLKQPQDHWPKQLFHSDRTLVNLEIDRQVLVTTHVRTEVMPWFERFSNFTKIVRINAWIRRFIRNTQKFVPISRGDSINGLMIIRDDFGLIRIKSKLIERDDEYSFRYPVLLPTKHHVVTCLIREFHLKHCHAGVQILSAKLRENYWILNSRRSIRSVVSQCAKCRRFSSKPVKTIPIHLPLDRVRDATAFEILGVDLAVPLYLKNKTKAWIVQFTCAVFRAIHLELVTSLSTEAFIQDLRKFIARRGRPTVIYSDNGTNFVGANNALRALNWKKIVLDQNLHKINWKFIPPTAAWWGGWWERLIRSIKDLLVRILGHSSVYYEEMSTILCDVDATINSRPLTYIHEDSDGLIPLSPSMFLHDSKYVGVPDLDKLDSKKFQDRYRHCQRLREALRSRFRSEYLGQLVQKANERTPKLSVGVVVIVKVEDKRRLHWPMARIVELFPGRDGHSRVAKVRTKLGTHIRPVQKLYPLEVSSGDPILRSKGDTTIEEAH